MIGLHWTVTTGWLRACFCSLPAPPLLSKTHRRDLRREVFFFLQRVSSDIIWTLRHRDGVAKMGHICYCLGVTSNCVTTLEKGDRTTTYQVQEGNARQACFHASGFSDATVILHHPAQDQKTHIIPLWNIQDGDH